MYFYNTNYSEETEVFLSFVKSVNTNAYNTS